MAASTSPRRPVERRRQRSVRVTVAVVLLGAATALVAAALIAQSVPWLSGASAAAVVLGWAATRMVWTEVLQSRWENAADRANSADAYRALFAERASEHAEFTAAMTERLAIANTSVRELQGQVAYARRDAAEQRDRAEVAERGLAVARGRIGELERSVEILHAERETEREAAQRSGGPGSMEDLVAFDERIARAVGGKHARSDAKPA